MMGLLVALPFELSLDILIDWVAVSEKELSALDVAHTSHSDRIGILFLMSKIPVVHKYPTKDLKHSPLLFVSRRSSICAHVSWMLSRQIKLQRECVRNRDLAAIAPLLSTGCFQHVEVLSIVDYTCSNGSAMFSADDLRAVLDACPNLKELHFKHTNINASLVKVLRKCRIPLRKVYFDQASRGLNLQGVGLHRAIRAFAASLVVLHIQNVRNVDQSLFQAIGRCVNLVTLTLPCSTATVEYFLAAYQTLPNLKQLVIDSKTDANSFESESLEELVGTCVQLTSLDISSETFVSAASCLQALRTCPWLDSFSTPYWNFTRCKDLDLNLELGDLNICCKAASHRFSREELRALLSSCPGDITGLHLSWDFFVMLVGAQPIVNRFGSHLLLLELYVGRGAALDLVARCPALRKLVLRGKCKFTDDAAMLAIADNCSRLQHLTLIDLDLVTDLGIVYLTDHLPLVSISLKNNKKLTGRSVECAMSCPEIQRIWLTGADITTQDIVRYVSLSRPGVQLTVNECHKPAFMEYLRNAHTGFLGRLWMNKLKFVK